jgi:hypothetical protein
MKVEYTEAVGVLPPRPPPISAEYLESRDQAATDYAGSCAFILHLLDPNFSRESLVEGVRAAGSMTLDLGSSEASEQHHLHHLFADGGAWAPMAKRCAELSMAAADKDDEELQAVAMAAVANMARVTPSAAYLVVAVAAGIGSDQYHLRREALRAASYLGKDEACAARLKPMIGLLAHLSEDDEEEKDEPARQHATACMAVIKLKSSPG